MSQKFFSYTESSIGDVPIITLKFDNGKHNVSASIAVKAGNNLFSYIIDGHETLFYDPSLPLASFAVGTPVLFPFPNRIDDAIWTWKGEKRLQKKNGIPIQLHSLLYDETSFENDAPIVHEDCVSLRTFIKVDESHPVYKGYPFCFTLYFDYTLSESGLKVSYRLENESNEEMPFGLGFHPYFTKLSGETNTKLTVPCDYFYEVRSDADPEFFNKTANGLGMTGNVMPTGNLIEAKGTSSDILTPKSVGNLDLDTVYTSVQHNPKAMIDYSDIGLTLTLDASEEFTHYVVYTPQGKSFFCIEPQTCSTDAINLFAAGIEHVNLLICPKNSIKEGWVTYSFNA